MTFIMVLMVLSGDPVRVTKGRAGQQLSPRCSELATQAQTAQDEYVRKAQAATACYAETERAALEAGKFREFNGVKLALVPPEERARCERLSADTQQHHETELFETQCRMLQECGTTCIAHPTPEQRQEDVRQWEAINGGKKCPPPPAVKSS